MNIRAGGYECPDARRAEDVTGVVLGSTSEGTPAEATTQMGVQSHLLMKEVQR